MYRPDIRKHFRDVVSQTTLGQLSRSKLQRLRYVTVGSGSLLTDFEILCALDSLGVAIDSIICVATASGRNIANMCSESTQRGPTHALVPPRDHSQHDNRHAGGVARANHLLLLDGHLRYRYLHAQVASRNHDRVAGVENSVKILYRLRGLDFRDDLWQRAARRPSLWWPSGKNSR